MQDYNTIIGVIQLRQNNCSFSVIEARYHIGSNDVSNDLNNQKGPSSDEPLFMDYCLSGIFVFMSSANFSSLN